MKTILLGLFALMSFSKVYSQNITFSDLKYVLYHRLDETQDFLAKKGFGFSRLDTLYNANQGDSVGVSYTFEKIHSASQVKSKKQIVILKLAHNGKFYSDQCYTEFVSDYIALKTSIKNLGFKMTSTYMNGQQLVFVYKKGSLEVSIYTWKDERTEVSKYNFALIDDVLKLKAWSNK